jgi:NAD(P)-dependent dehydrogenase (short-subunit alcohol dehydrogenase family)
MTDHPFSLRGQRVTVIGGSSGIGLAVAQLAQDLGAALMLASSTSAKVDAALARLPGAEGALVDLRSETSIVAFLDSLGPVDHLVLTGGDTDPRRFAPTDELTLAVAHEALEARLFGSIAAIKHGRARIRPGGSITLTSGVLSQRPRKGSPLPAVTMGAVEQVVRGFAVDLAPLRINAVRPGLTLTDTIVARGTDRAAALTAGLPIARAASPEEVARAYIYLMQAHYTTGLVLPVDGGGLLV